MQTLVELLQSVAIFLGGMLARFGLFLVLVAVLVVPAVALALALRAVATRRERRLGIRSVDGVPFRPDLAYAPGHLWLHRRGGGALEVGLDGIAQRLVPSVTAVELPRPGDHVIRGERLLTLHGGGRALDLLAPISGTVAGVNAAVVRDPGLVKREGYGRGWLVAVAPEDATPDAFPRGAAAERWMRSESARWSRFLEERLGFAAADGGALVAPAPWLVGEAAWAALTAAFLHP